MSYQITELQAVADLEAVVALFSTVWGASEPLIDSSTLKALSRSGNYVAGAKSDGRLIGALTGFLGGHPPGPLHLHSHILGVAPDVEARGLGFALKQHQRLWCLERGIPTIEWTYDPLVRRNAYFNLTKLGAEAASYLVNFYGPMDDAINAGDESDRILVSWDLQSDKSKAAAAGHAVEPSVDPRAAILSVSASGEPAAKPIACHLALAQVPEDIVAVRRRDPALAKRWRRAVRATLGEAMATGYRVTGATRDGWYVLAAEPN